MDLQYDILKDYQRKNREDFPESLSLRVHRALSWLKNAEQGEDADTTFIALWIAFNAAYAQEIDRDLGVGDQALFQKFIKKLVQLDGDKLLYNQVWQEFSGSIRVLLKNPFVFRRFWDYQRGDIGEVQWKQSFEQANRAANAALAKQQTDAVLRVVFSRLYTLRNQIVHGGATWQSSVNRDQVRDAVAILGSLVPTIIRIMMLNPQQFPGEACYPVVDLAALPEA